MERLENGNYTFKANGSIVGAIGGLLFAIILEEDIPKATIEWTLHRDEQNTDGNAYVYAPLESRITLTSVLTRVLTLG